MDFLHVCAFSCCQFLGYLWGWTKIWKLKFSDFVCLFSSYRVHCRNLLKKNGMIPFLRSRTFGFIRLWETQLVRPLVTHKTVVFNCYDRTSVHCKFETAGERNKSLANLSQEVQTPNLFLLLDCLESSGIRNIWNSIGLLRK